MYVSVNVNVKRVFTSERECKCGRAIVTVITDVSAKACECERKRAREYER